MVPEEVMVLSRSGSEVISPRKPTLRRSSSALEPSRSVALVKSRSQTRLLPSAADEWPEEEGRFSSAPEPVIDPEREAALRAQLAALEQTLSQCTAARAEGQPVFQAAMGMSLEQLFAKAEDDLSGDWVEARKRAWYREKALEEKVSSSQLLETAIKSGHDDMVQLFLQAGGTLLRRDIFQALRQVKPTNRRRHATVVALWPLLRPRETEMPATRRGMARQLRELDLWLIKERSAQEVWTRSVKEEADEGHTEGKFNVADIRAMTDEQILELFLEGKL